MLKSVVWQGKETKQTSVSDSRAGEEERRGPTEDGDTVSDEGVDESVLDELEKEKQKRDVGQRRVERRRGRKGLNQQQYLSRRTRIGALEKERAWSVESLSSGGKKRDGEGSRSWSEGRRASY